MFGLPPVTAISIILCTTAALAYVTLFVIDYRLTKRRRTTWKPSN